MLAWHTESLLCDTLYFTFSQAVAQQGNCTVIFWLKSTPDQPISADIVATYSVPHLYMNGIPQNWDTGLELPRSGAGWISPISCHPDQARTGFKHPCFAYHAKDWHWGLGAQKITTHSKPSGSRPLARSWCRRWLRHPGRERSAAGGSKRAWARPRAGWWDKPWWAAAGGARTPACGGRNPPTPATTPIFPFVKGLLVVMHTSGPRHPDELDNCRDGMHKTSLKTGDWSPGYWRITASDIASCLVRRSPAQINSMRTDSCVVITTSRQVRCRLTWGISAAARDSARRSSRQHAREHSHALYTLPSPQDEISQYLHAHTYPNTPPLQSKTVCPALQWSPQGAHLQEGWLWLCAAAVLLGSAQHWHSGGGGASYCAILRCLPARCQAKQRHCQHCAECQQLQRPHHGLSMWFSSTASAAEHVLMSLSPRTSWLRPSLQWHRNTPIAQASAARSVECRTKDRSTLILTLLLWKQRRCTWGQYDAGRNSPGGITKACSTTTGLQRSLRRRLHAFSCGWCLATTTNERSIM